MKDEIERGFGELLHCLEDFIRSETVVGKPITIGQTTVIPLFRVSLGLGAGWGSPPGEKTAARADSRDSNPAGTTGTTGTTGTSGTAGSAGSGAGAAITPYGVISVAGGETKVLPLARNSLQKITDMLPELLAQTKDLPQKKQGREQGRDSTC